MLIVKSMFHFYITLISEAHLLSTSLYAFFQPILHELLVLQVDLDLSYYNFNLAFPLAQLSEFLLIVKDTDKS